MVGTAHLSRAGLSDGMRATPTECKQTENKAETNYVKHLDLKRKDLHDLYMSPVQNEKHETNKHD